MVFSGLFFRPLALQMNMTSKNKEKGCSSTNGRDMVSGTKKLKDSLETQQGIQVQVSMGPSFPLYHPFPKMFDT